jgi:hypothetical protein
VAIAFAVALLPLLAGPLARFRALLAAERIEQRAKRAGGEAAATMGRPEEQP